MNFMKKIVVSTALLATSLVYAGGFRVSLPVSYTHLDVYKRQR